MNEYSTLFDRDQIGLQIYGLIGGERTLGHQVVPTGSSNKVSFSRSEFRFRTDGFRPNNDAEQKLYDGFLQIALTPHTNVQAEITSSTRNFGDLISRFDANFFDPIIRNRDKANSFRLGVRQTLT